MNNTLKLTVRISSETDKWLSDNYVCLGYKNKSDLIRQILRDHIENNFMFEDWFKHLVFSWKKLNEKRNEDDIISR